MALRPVSELGLVEVTDLAAPPSPAPKRTSPPRSGRDRAAPPEASESAKARPAARRRGRREPEPESTRLETGLTVLGGALGVAGAFLCVRSMLKR